METNSQHRRRAHRRLSLVVAAICGAAFALLVVFSIVVVLGRDSDQPFSAEDMSTAAERWSNAGPRSYDIEVMLVKQRTEVHRVEVRDNNPVRYTLDGLEMTRRRTFDTWTVPGMFGTIESDLENIRLVSEGQASAATPRLSLWGSVHPKYGFLERYRRIQWGSKFEVRWEVTEFTIVED